MPNDPAKDFVSFSFTFTSTHVPPAGEMLDSPSGAGLAAWSKHGPPPSVSSVPAS